MSSTERQQATARLVNWWPDRDEEGLRWLAISRALHSLGTMDRIPAQRLDRMVTWARSVLARPADGVSAERRVSAAAQIVRLLSHSIVGRPAADDHATLLTNAAARFPCEAARTVEDLVRSAVVAAAAERPCEPQASVRADVDERLRQGRSSDLTVVTDTLAILAPLATVGVLNPEELRATGQATLDALGQPGYERGGDLGQSGVVNVLDAITTAGATSALPPAQVQTLRRIVRSEARLPDATSDGDPADTAVALAALRLLGQSVPATVDWDAPLSVQDRTTLALALDRDQLPPASQVRAALSAQPPSILAQAYLTVAHPGLCTDQTRALRRTINSMPDLHAWSSDRLFHVVLLIVATADCGGADQQQLIRLAGSALDVAQRDVTAEKPGTHRVVDTWYLAEAGCLLGKPTRYLPQGELPSDWLTGAVDPQASIHHLYAVVRLAELMRRPSYTCGKGWWAARPAN
ncbi:hypothetical protein [Micromonospora nigra]|nr:hypothetical protein [Micromonospora nigra]